MALQFEVRRKILHFAFDARTSRGALKEKTSWYVRIWDQHMPERAGVGECAPLEGLSVDFVPDYEEVLSSVMSRIALSGGDAAETIRTLATYIPTNYPSILFGVETALHDLLNGGVGVVFRNSFILGAPIPINGLIWMGDEAFMMKQVEEKTKAGFDCLKMKIGGLDFDRECDILQSIRNRYGNDLTLRLDANGSFPRGEALARLDRLSSLTIHSIEQPVAARDTIMRSLCENSPIPIALDEELIGVNERSEKVKLLSELAPQYIILKPTLHGGFYGCEEWISIASSLNIGWWITSALESNVGLNAICQFTANYPIEIPQGLGTGGIYTNNEPSKLRVSGGRIFHS